MRGIETKDQLARALAEETGFYIKNMREVLDALDRIIVKNLKQARMDELSQVYIAKGVSIIGRRVPEQEARNPQTGKIECISGEKVIPKADFSRAFRDKLWKGGHGYERRRLDRLHNQNKQIKKQQEKSGDGT